VLLAQSLYGGIYQRTKDGKTIVWNNYPAPNDQATWSGKRDANGYATGPGTLTWYTSQKAFTTGSMLPAKGPPAVITRLTGTMVKGKLNGPVINLDSEGKTFRLTYVNGVKAGDRHGDSAGKSTERENDPVSLTDEETSSQPNSQDASAKALANTNKTSVELPAEGPSEAASPNPQLVMLAKSTRSVSAAGAAPSSSSSSPEDLEAAIKGRMISDFKEETQSVLARVDEATSNFRGVDRLEAIQKLPAPVSENVASLVDRARAVRTKLGYETALKDCAAETQTVDALGTLDQVTRSIASNDAAEATAKVSEFLKNNPQAAVDGQKNLWRYLTSMRQLCSQLESDAKVHTQRADSLAAASRTADAIRELQEAYRIFPNPVTAEKIRQLQNNSLGL